jgi:hypothetical protein
LARDLRRQAALQVKKVSIGCGRDPFDFFRGHFQKLGEAGKRVPSEFHLLRVEPG